MTTESETEKTFECVNCSQSYTLTDGDVSSSSSFKLTIQHNDNDSKTDETGPKEQEVSYDAALKEVFQLQHLKKLKGDNSTTTQTDGNLNPATSSSSNEKLCLCSDCSTIFAELYEIYLDFVSHQKSNSILHNKIAIINRGLSVAFANKENAKKPQVNNMETQTEIIITAVNTTNTTTTTSTNSETTNVFSTSSDIINDSNIIQDINNTTTTTSLNEKSDIDSDLIEAEIEYDDGGETQEMITDDNTATITTITTSVPSTLINPPWINGNILKTKKNERMAKFPLESPNLKVIVKIEPESPLPLISEICEDDIDIDIEGEIEADNELQLESTQECKLLMRGDEEKEGEGEAEDEEEEEEEEEESVNLSTVSVGSRAMSPDFTTITSGSRKVKSAQKVKPKPAKNTIVSTTTCSNSINNNTNITSNSTVIEKKGRRAANNNNNNNGLNNTNNNKNDNNTAETKTGGTGRRNKIMKLNPTATITPAPTIYTTASNNNNNKLMMIENSNEIKPRPRGRPKKQLPILNSSLPSSSSLALVPVIQQGKKKAPLPLSGEKVKKRSKNEHNNNNNRKSVTTEVKPKVSTRVSIKKQQQLLQQQEQLRKLVNERKRNPKTISSTAVAVKKPVKRKSKTKDLVPINSTITTVALLNSTTTAEKKRRSKRNKVTGKTVDWDKNKTNCSICNSNFTNAFICFRHEFLMHAMADQRPPYTCEKCNTVFKWKEKYFRHRHGLSGCGIDVMDSSSGSEHSVELQDVSTQMLAIEAGPFVSAEDEGDLVPISIVMVYPPMCTENQPYPVADVVPTAETNASMVEVCASPIDASVSPVDASVSAVDASVSAVDASVSPVDASVSPVDASISPVDASVSVLDVSASPVDASISPVDTSTLTVDASTCSADDSALKADTSDLTPDASASTPNLLGNDEMEKTGGKTRKRRRLSAPDDEFVLPSVKSSRRRTLTYM